MIDLTAFLVYSTLAISLLCVSCIISWIMFSKKNTNTDYQFKLFIHLFLNLLKTHVIFHKWNPQENVHCHTSHYRNCIYHLRRRTCSLPPFQLTKRVVPGQTQSMSSLLRYHVLSISNRHLKGIYWRYVHQRSRKYLYENKHLFFSYWSLYILYICVFLLSKRRNEKKWTEYKVELSVKQKFCLVFVFGFSCSVKTRHFINSNRAGFTVK